MPYRRVAPLVYRDTRTGHLYERPKIAGRWTWRRLQARTLKLAREEVFARRQAQVRAVAGLGRDPYAPAALSVGALLARWQAAGCPNSKLAARTGEQLRQARCACARLVAGLGAQPAEGLYVADCIRYGQRRQPATRGADVELSHLVVALSWAHRAGLISRLPELANRPRLHTVRHHHRDFMPGSADELHSLAVALFEVASRVALGFQLLLQAFTGLRCSEAVRLRWDAAPRGPGWLEGGYLWLQRSKKGVNPFALVHPALETLLQVMHAYRQVHWPGCPWFIPGPGGHGSARPWALAHVLGNLEGLSGGQRRTSHGLRAFYATVRRSQGIPDGQIAAEIGDKTGAAIIASTYGEIPPNWQAKAPLSWLPAQGEPAWTVLDLPRNIVPLSGKTIVCPL